MSEFYLYYLTFFKHAISVKISSKLRLFVVITVGVTDSQGGLLHFYLWEYLYKSFFKSLYFFHLFMIAISFKTHQIFLQENRYTFASHILHF